MSPKKSKKGSSEPVAEQKSVEQKPVEQKPVEQKPVEQKPVSAVVPEQCKEPKKRTPKSKETGEGCCCGSAKVEPATVVTPENIRQVLSKVMLVDGLDPVVDLRKSNGVWLYDSKAQRKLLDFFTFVASAPIGSNHPKMLADKDMLEKMQYASIVNPTQSDIYSVEMGEFVDTFRRLAMPQEMKYVFFIAGGALGVENALKAAFDWKVRKNFKKGYTKEVGHQVIHFQQSFHGRSGYTLSLTNTDPNKTNYFPKFDWPRIINPKVQFPLTPESLANLEKVEAEAVQQIKAAFQKNKDDIAALIIEPIQGEGGDNHFRKEFLMKLRELTLENDCILIFDEVQCGVGLTGSMWASQQLVMPDMIAFGKKMQVCGFMSSTRIDEVPENVFKVSSRINSTWGGALSDMVRAKKYLEIIHEDKLVENAKTVGATLLGYLEGLAKEFPAIVSNARGRGLMCAFDLPNKDVRGKFIDGISQNGAIMLGSGERSVRFRPPLTLTADEAKQGVEIIRTTLKGMQA